MKFKSGYIEEIDGLRGLSIIAVLLFHVFPETFWGGYLGVDIFFVISGFVITRSLVNEYSETKKISLLSFYYRRIKRLAPAFLVMILFVLLFIFLVVPRHEFSFITRGLFSAILQYSNFHLINEGNYFSELGHLNFLVHTWSLSIEEQFYFIFPFFLLLVLNFKKKVAIVSLFFIVAFLFFVYRINIYIDPDLSSWSKGHRLFLHTFGRIPQFFLGGLIAVTNYKSNIKPVILSTISMLITIVFAISIFYIESELNEVFYSYIYITVAAIILVYISQLGVKNYLLSNFIFKKIGKISYGLYLYHWPFFIFASYIYFDKLTFNMRVCVLVMSLIVSIFSYYFIELKLKNKLFKNKKIFVSGFVLFFILLGFLIKSIPQNNYLLNIGYSEESKQLINNGLYDERLIIHQQMV